MYISFAVFAFFAFFVSLGLSSSLPSSSPVSADLLYWPVTASSPSNLARISYDSNSLELVSYSPPNLARGAQGEFDEIVRVGLYTSGSSGSKQWVGTLVSLSSLASSESQNLAIRLHLNPTNEVYHVSLLPSTSKVPAKSPIIELVSSETGPRPHLNRPVVVSLDGQNPEEIPEKTLFQRYWWVFLIVTFLAMSGGGEGHQ